ncbi:MAG TPA: alpha/beta fold hydrolase [Dongiaceae bacterium]|nr:alpha/beta fold hydrolase [Dongiaceae bacterium]
MSILFELRYPTKWYTKLFTAVVALVFFTGLATLAIAGFLVYRIVKPNRTSTEINMATFPGRPDAINFEVPGPNGAREGWFFPGFRGAPTIILCHGYESSKGELLTLVSALQEHQYNVFVFDFVGHGANNGITAFGYRETAELKAAMDAVAQRNDVDPSSFGVWGYNMGAYVALREAESDKRVRGLVLDSVYDEPKQMVMVEVRKTGLGGFPFMVRAAEFSFDWLNYEHRQDPPLSARLGALTGVPKLFLQPGDDRELGETTRQLFTKSPEPRELVMLPNSNFVSLSEDEKRTYENRVVTFFLLRLPPTPASPAKPAK